MGSRLKTLALVVIALLALIVPNLGTARAEFPSGGPLPRSACAVRGHNPNGCPVHAQSVTGSREGNAAAPQSISGGREIVSRPRYDGSPVAKYVVYNCYGKGYKATATMYVSGFNSGAQWGYVWYFYIPFGATNVVVPQGVEVHYTMGGCQTKFQGLVTATPQQSYQHEAYYDLTWGTGNDIGTSYPWTALGTWGTTGTLNPGL